MRHSIPVLVAHAIHRHIDIIEDFPDCRDFTEQQIEIGIRGFIAGVQNLLTTILTCYGAEYFAARDPVGLFGLLRGYGVRFQSLQKMCQFMIDVEEGAIILPEVGEGHVGEYETSKVFEALKRISPFNP